MDDLNASYKVIGNDQVPLGEVVKQVFYDAQGHPDGCKLTERGLENESGDIVACWEADRRNSSAPAYLVPKK